MLGRTAEAELRHLRLAQWHQSGTQEHLGERAVGGHRARTTAGGAAWWGIGLDGDVALMTDGTRRSSRLQRAGGGRGLVWHGERRHTLRLVQHGSTRPRCGQSPVEEFGRRHCRSQASTNVTDGIKVAQRVVAESVASVCSWAVSLIAAHAGTVPSRTADV